MERNKIHTKEKLLNAVGTILAEDGFSALGVNKVAKKAEVDKRLIYRYFGTFDNLLEEFLTQRDYWMTIVDRTNKTVTDKSMVNLLDLIVFFLEKQWNTFSQSKILQQIMLWSISEPDNPLMAKLIENREKVGSAIFKKTDGVFNGSQIDYRAIAAILVAGIYYLSLHASANKGTFCEIDLHDELGQAEIKNAIRLINEWAFRAANNKS